jgi:Zn-dependent peptidase ImmA (M78 family)
MTRFVPYLSEEQIERDAAALLAEYAQARGVTIAPPIPIEDIVEKHLKLGIEFDDTHRLFGVPRPGLDPDILGAMFFDEARIVIDESLDPEENPAKEGRYFYTVAHEGGGHWRLHRHLFAKDPAQAALFGGPVAPSVICRSSQAKERVEWQADFYASCLLMPRRLVHAEWHARLGRTKPLLLSDLRPNRTVLMRAETLIREQGKGEAEAVDDALFENVAERIARRFGVSRIAMRIRLEKLGLLLRAEPRQQPMTGIL